MKTSIQTFRVARKAANPFTFFEFTLREMQATLMANGIIDMNRAEISCTPSSILQLNLATETDISSVVMVLENKQDNPVAFRVMMKKAQQQLYLVQPNQGILEPSDCISVTVVMVKKYKQALLNHLGTNSVYFAQSNINALFGDKFVVQSCALPIRGILSEQLRRFGVSSSREQSVNMRSLWRKNNGLPCVNRTMMVKHTLTNEELSYSTTTL
mmetsp:Transcript_19322/g.28774  ORF Transcript_19322/g.28774 Transcript_19322/m.28774 type:complete len:213 (+) Transcript_19322:767-1405(+)